MAIWDLNGLIRIRSLLAAIRKKAFFEKIFATEFLEMNILVFIISLFLTSLASHVESWRIKSGIEIIKKKQPQRIISVFARYPALAILLTYAMTVIHLSPVGLVLIFLACHGSSIFLLRSKKAKRLLLDKQNYLDAFSVVFVLVLWCLF